MLNTHKLNAFVLSTLVAGCVLIGATSTGFAQASSGPMCSVVQPDSCLVETFAGASNGSKGTSWTFNGWDFDVYNPNGVNIRVNDAYTDFGTAVRIGCYTTKIEIPDELPVRYVSFLVDGASQDRGWMEVLAIDSTGNIIDQTFRFNEQAHGAEAVYLGPVQSEIDAVVIHTMNGPGLNTCSFRCSQFYLGEIRACEEPRTN